MTRSTPANTYDDDFYAWTQEQAAALRRMPAAGEDIDVAHLAEEIEDLGKRDLREVISYLTLLVEHLLKIEALPASRDRPHWGSEAAHFQRSARGAFAPSMRRLLDLGVIWKDSRKAASRFLKDAGADVEITSKCPFALDELLSPDFEIDDAVAKIAALRATDRHP